MPDAVAVLVSPGFAEFEVTVALALLGQKFRVVNVGLKNQLVLGEGGLRVYPDLTLEKVVPADYAAFILPGAVDLTPLMLGPEELFDLVARFAMSGGVLAAIGNAPYLLARAGLLTGMPYTATLTRQQREELLVFPEAGFQYQAVVQGRHEATGATFMTAQSHAFVEFGLTVAQALEAVADVERARTFYSGRGNAGMEADQM